MNSLIVKCDRFLVDDSTLDSSRCIGWRSRTVYHIVDSSSERSTSDAAQKPFCNEVPVVRLLTVVVKLAIMFFGLPPAVGIQVAILH